MIGFFFLPPIFFSLFFFFFYPLFLSYIYFHGPAPQYRATEDTLKTKNLGSASCQVTPLPLPAPNQSQAAVAENLAQDRLLDQAWISIAHP